VRDLSTAAQNGVDESTPGTPVAVDERVDVLELRVCDGGLCDGREVGAVDESAEVLQQLGDLLVRRTDIRSAYWVIVVSTDPALGGAKDPRDLAILGEPEQRAMDLLDVRDG
jgi:hypothetical protein